MFLPLFGLSDGELSVRGIRRETADDSVPGFPCRVTLAEAAPGETLLLLNFEHQPARTPYRSAHAIYVREIARRTFDAIDEIPAPLRHRMAIEDLAAADLVFAHASQDEGAPRFALNVDI